MRKNSRWSVVIVASLAVVLGLALVSSTTGDDGSRPSEEALPEGQVRKIFPVSGMTCGGCALAIKMAVKKLDGVVEVTVDHERGNAAVTYVAGKVTADKIVEAINKTGFKASRPEEDRKS